MTSISSHSTTRHSRELGNVRWVSCPTECRLLAASICAGGVFLAVTQAVASGPEPSTGIGVRLAALVGLFVVALGLRLVLLLPNRRVFARRPFVLAAALLTFAASGLWLWVVRAAPIDALLRRQPLIDFAVGVGVFFLACMCTTLVVGAASGAWEARREERAWGLRR